MKNKHNKEIKCCEEEATQKVICRFFIIVILFS